MCGWLTVCVRWSCSESHDCSSNLCLKGACVFPVGALALHVCFLLFYNSSVTSVRDWEAGLQQSFKVAMQMLVYFPLNRHRCHIPSHQQVSLARSSPVKDGDGQGDRLLLTSYDRTLVVKKITSEEVADMHNILSEYHQVRRISQVQSYLMGCIYMTRTVLLIT